LFRSAIDPDLFASSAAKEVRHHLQALRAGIGLCEADGLLRDAWRHRS
jgi:hypothetical protein